MSKIQQVSEKEYYGKFAVSNSSLSWFKLSPKYFISKLRGEITEDVPKAYFELGRQIHMKVLETDDFYNTYAYVDVDLPTSKQQKDFAEKYIKSKKKTIKDRAIEAYKATYTIKGKSDDKIEQSALDTHKKLKKYLDHLEKTKDAKVVLSWPVWNQINIAAKALVNHKGTRSLLIDDEFSSVESFNELPIFWEWQGVKCKSMLDRVIIDHDNKVIKLVDVKTTYNVYKFGKSFGQFGYNRQCAYYWLAFEYWFKENYPDKKFEDYNQETYIAAVNKDEKIPEARAFRIKDKYLDEGLKEISEIMPEIKWHFNNDKWDYTKDYYEGNGIDVIMEKDYEEGKSQRSD